MSGISAPRKKAFEKVFNAMSANSLLTVTGVFVLLLLALSLVFPATLQEVCHQANNWIYGLFGNFYLMLTAGMLVICALLMISPWGKVKLGKPGDKPAFDHFSWFAMLFCAGMGTGFLFWGGAEPLFHFQNPPLLTQLPKEQALALTYFHWGLSPWAIYALTAIAIGYFCNLKDQPLRFSQFLQCKQPWQAFLVDGILILALVFGISATFGMGVLMIESGLGQLLHIAPSIPLKLGIIVCMTALFLFSAYRGLSQGIRFLSNTSLILTIVLLGIFFWVMPKAEAISDLFGSVSLYATQLPKWSFGIGHFQPESWPREWTVKYWSWWLAWAPFVGSFIALISKGRSIRQILLGSMLAPTLFSIIWFFVMGESAFEWSRATGATRLIFDDAQHVWFGMLDHYTGSLLLALFSVLMIGVFVCDSLDSASFTLCSLSIGLTPAEENPEKKKAENKNNDEALPEEAPFAYVLCWGGVLAALTASLLASGGIQILQEVTPITVLPFCVILLAVIAKFLYALIFVERPVEQSTTKELSETKKRAAYLGEPCAEP